MRTRHNRYPYVGRRSARMSFLAGIGVVLMLIIAVACVALAVFIVLDYNMPGATGSGSVLPVYGAVGRVGVVPPGETAPAYAASGAEPQNPLADAPGGNPNLTRTVFSMLPFYISENAEAYSSFYAERPELDFETIVWKVNVSLHLPFFTEIQTNYEPNPLLISPFFRLPPGFSPPVLVPVNHENDHLLATPETVAAFRRIRGTAQEAGYELVVTSAYRSAEHQERLFTRGGSQDGAIARPYHSEHQTGRALDLWGPGGLLDAQGPSPTGRWIAENAHLYGFIVRYLAETTHITGYIHEPWHITYVGLEISLYMHNNNILSLEEFVGRNPGITLPVAR